MARITLSSEQAAKLAAAGFTTPSKGKTPVVKEKSPSWGSTRHHSLLWQAIAKAAEELDSLGWSEEESKDLIGQEAKRYTEARERLEAAQAKLHQM